MELLVATLAHTARGANEEALARVRLVVDTMKNVPGILNTRLYAGREGDGSYLILTSWEDEEFWRRAQEQERQNPRDLLYSAVGELLTAAPEQWQMCYLWGYSRPSARPTVAAVHLATVQPDAIERIQRAWIENLQRQAAQLALAFAFFTRGRKVDSGPHTANGSPAQQEGIGGSTFLNLLSWPDETQQREYYADLHYKAFRGYLNQVGMERVLLLEPRL